jgi:predicted metalloprotease with PDZ domain
MTQYTISVSRPHRHFIDIEARFQANGQSKMQVQLPAWRPGRYELANFAQNIQRWEVYDEKGNPLPNKKLTKDLWQVDCGGAKEVIVKYNYYANQLDAGSTYYDEQQLYVNPVNCLLYEPGKLDSPCTIILEGLPDNYKIASGLNFNGKREALVDSFHTLVDSPFIASGSLMHETYAVQDYTFHIWIQGECVPDWERIKKEFSRFTEAQLKLFGELPVKEYHFLYQLPNFKFYHGVEHLDSTVICLGPGYKLMEEEMYQDFVGISSHELFHSWNIKSIRPADMMPYDYSKENYTNLGYIAEGVTTYYGDLMLLRSGVYSWNQYAQEWQTFLHRHFHVFGRYYQTLAQSSFDTWLDGYKPGIPDRKVNMYVKGMLVAFILDVSIRKDTENAKSLDDVMRALYNDFAKAKKGYSEEDYLDIVNSLTSRDYKSFFEKYVWGLDPIESPLEEALSRIGCRLTLTPSEKTHERVLGIKLKEDQGLGTRIVIAQVAPDSPADHAGISVNDEILAVNGTQADCSTLEGLLKLHVHDPMNLELSRTKRVVTVEVKPGKEEFFPVYSVSKKDNASEAERVFFEKWTGQEFEKV